MVSPIIILVYHLHDIRLTFSGLSGQFRGLRMCLRYGSSDKSEQNGYNGNYTQELQKRKSPLLRGAMMFHLAFDSARLFRSRAQSPNAAHQWRAAKDARYGTKAQSARLLHALCVRLTWA
jgi:hypothetical protein